MNKNKLRFIDDQLEMRDLDNCDIYNSQLCTECGGDCCKRNSCALAPIDLGDSVTEEAILKKLDTGDFMITAHFIMVPISRNPIQYSLWIAPYMAARESESGEFNFTARHTSCKHLGPFGCTLDRNHKPCQGILLIPQPFKHCINAMEEPTILWKPYRNLLINIVEKKTGKPISQYVDEELKNTVKLLERKIENHLAAGRPLSIQDATALRDLVSLSYIDAEDLRWLDITGVAPKL